MDPIEDSKTANYSRGNGNANDSLYNRNRGDGGYDESLQRPPKLRLGQQTKTRYLYNGSAKSIQPRGNPPHLLTSSPLSTPRR